MNNKISKEKETEYVEQIKAIAKDIPYIKDCDWWYCNGCSYFEHYGLSKDTCKEFRIAQELFEKGYRKADEVRKETAQEIYNRMKAVFDLKDKDHVTMTLYKRGLNGFFVDYGVEVEE